MALWDFVSGDADGVPPAESKARYDATVAQHPGNILALNHEPFAGTAYALISSSIPRASIHRSSPLLYRYDVLPHAIQVLQNAGYRLVTVAECVGQNPYQWVADPQTPGVRLSLSRLCGHVLTVATSPIGTAKPSLVTQSRTNINELAAVPSVVYFVSFWVDG